MLWIGMVCCIIFIVILCISFFSRGDTPKDKILHAYNSVMQSFEGVGLTKDANLKGKREFGKDTYVGTYKANYEVASGEETLFGGTLLHRENGDHIQLSLKVQKQSGNIKAIGTLGENEITLIEDTGDYEDTIYIDGISYYLTIRLDNFTGSIEVISE